MSGRATERSLQKQRFEATRFPDEVYTGLIGLLNRSGGEPVGGTCIHLMSGYGHLSAKLARAWNCRIVAIEPDDRIRSEAARRNAYSSLIYMKADETRLPLQDHEAAALIAMQASVRVSNIERLVEEMMRTLSPGSWGFFMESGGLFGAGMNHPGGRTVSPTLSSIFLDRLADSFSKRKAIGMQRMTWTVPMPANGAAHAQQLDSMVAAGLVPEGYRLEARVEGGDVIEQSDILRVAIG